MTTTAAPAAPRSSIIWFLLVMLTVAISLIVMAVAMLGYSTISGSIDLAQGFKTLGSMFGGFLSLIALIGVIVAIGLVVWLFYTMTQTNYTGHGGLQALHIGLGFVVIILAAIFGFRWINLGQDFWLTIKVILGFLLLSWLTAFAAARLLNRH